MTSRFRISTTTDQNSLFLSLWNNFSGPAKTLQVFSPQIVNFFPKPGYMYPVDTTTGQITATLPKGQPGDCIGFCDYSGTFMQHTGHWCLNYI